MEISNNDIQQAIDEQVASAVDKYGKGIKLVLISIIGLLKMQLVQEQTTLIPIAQWDKPYPSKGSLRQWHFNRDNNDTEKIGVWEYGGESGGTILVNEQKLNLWLKSRKKVRAENYC